MYFAFNGGDLKIWAKNKIAFKDNDLKTTGSPTNPYYGLFENCKNLTSITLDNISTSKLEYMGRMFYNCKNLLTLDLSNFDTSSATNMEYMFAIDFVESPMALQSINLSSFNTSNVTNFNNMFDSCEYLTILDLSSFDTSSCTKFNYMFCYCQELNAIYVSDNFVVDEESESDSMFLNCSKLVGGNGTVYNGSHIDKEYAVIDGTEDKPGYFTSINDKPTSDEWFTFNPIMESETKIGYSITSVITTGSYSKNLNIPLVHKESDDYEALPVIKIEDDAFNGVFEDDKFESIIISKNISTIGKNAFKNSIDSNTAIKFVENSHTWTIENNNELVTYNFNPRTASKTDIVNYLTGDYTWTKNKIERIVLGDEYESVQPVGGYCARNIDLKPNTTYRIECNAKEEDLTDGVYMLQFSNEDGSETINPNDISDSFIVKLNGERCNNTWNEGTCIILDSDDLYIPLYLKGSITIEFTTLSNLAISTVNLISVQGW